MEYILTEKESDIILEYYQKLVGEQIECLPEYKGYKINQVLGFIFGTDQYSVSLIISKEVENAKPDEAYLDLFDYLFAKIEKELNIDNESSN